MRIIKNFLLVVWVLFAVGCCVKQVGPDTNFIWIQRRETIQTPDFQKNKRGKVRTKLMICS